MSARRHTGSRFLYEPFDVTSARIEAHERVSEERWLGLERRLNTIEMVLERVEKRLWLAVSGVVAGVILQGVYSLIAQQ
ncbi:hypothetical protein ACMA5I_12705 [Paracoccaceae bacterium GXU_MW_L88]